LWIELFTLWIKGRKTGDAVDKFLQLHFQVHTVENNPQVFHSMHILYTRGLLEFSTIYTVILRRRNHLSIIKKYSSHHRTPEKQKKNISPEPHPESS